MFASSLALSAPAYEPKFVSQGLIANESAPGVVSPIYAERNLRAHLIRIYDRMNLPIIQPTGPETTVETDFRLETQ